jgi:DNA-directed RNA polymerase specialized sigma24 family protein
VSQRLERYYRRIAQSVLTYYCEIENGTIRISDAGRIFDERLINYRIDVEKVMAKFSPREQEAVLLIHRDGLTHADAVKLAGISATRPDWTIASIEVRLGRVFEESGLDDLVGYLED